MMTTAQKKNVTLGSIVAGGILASALLGFAGFETKAAHSADVTRLEDSHEKQFLRLLCEVEASRRNDINKVCR